jgi:hypothetical protein
MRIMPDLPLLRLPNPNPVDLPSGPRGGSNLRLPSKRRQRDRFGPVFDRLKTVLSRANGMMELRDDPTSLAPERVIVFEIGGTVANFLNALSKIDGLEFMSEYDIDFEPDEDFAVVDGRSGREGHVRTDKAVPGRFYLALPDMRALAQLLGLWDRWNNDEPLGRGYAPFGHLFSQLRDLRPWGPQDRIPGETIAFWREERGRDPLRPVRTEVELWYRDSETRRRTSSGAIRSLVAETGGQVIHESVISEIAYHGMLVDIPSGYVQNLIDNQAVSLALADEVMFLRPQSVMLDPLELESEAGGPPSEGAPDLRLLEPIAALLDGMPVQSHVLLANRLIIDDPDDIQNSSLVSQRVHGTAMASLILHGDRNEQGSPLPRPIYVRPLMITHENGYEHTRTDQLLIDTIHRAVVRMKGTDGGAGVAPTVFLVNLSMGDVRRPFSRVMSPLARLLDFLSASYNLLFFVSGGNITAPLEITDFQTWTSFEQANPGVRQRAVMGALNAAKHERTILSPAEALNALTIGAHHHDNIVNRQAAFNVVDPLEDSTLPNISSGLGLGYRRMIKPDLYLLGGREFVRMAATGERLRVAVAQPRRIYGLSAAAPDALGQGRLDQVALTAGTSVATALATRAGARIFEALMDREGGSLLSDIDPQFYPVVVKALLVHSARWSSNDELLKDICGPAEGRRHIERAENSARFVGFGIPDISQVLECSRSRATLVGSGILQPDSAHAYLIPLPACLEGVTDPRSLAITLAWLSPIKPGHQSYRSVRLEAAPLDSPVEILGVERRKSQPADASVKRGSVFHEHFEGESAVAFVNDGHLAVRVWCKEDAGVADGQLVRYGMAVTIEAGTALPVYEEIRQRLRIRPRP